MFSCYSVRYGSDIDKTKLVLFSSDLKLVIEIET